MVGGWRTLHVCLESAKCTTRKITRLPKFELNLENDTISYTKFTAHVWCTEHGSGSLEKFSKNPYHHCMKCEELDEAKQKKLKAKVQRKKFCTIDELPEKRGTYAKKLQKMFSHKYQIILGGKNFKKKTRLAHVQKRSISRVNGTFLRGLLLVKMARHSTNTLARTNQLVLKE